MYTIADINNTPPKASKFLLHRIMCGACKFKCCNSPSFDVECTKEEQKRLGLPARFPQEGQCRCLLADGCEHGAKRPVYCKFFPLQVKPSARGQTIVVSHWATLCCPHTTDYVLEGMEGGVYRYTRKQGINGAKANNSAEALELEVPIEEAYPIVLDQCAEAVEELFGVGTVERLRRAVTPNKGFGLI